MTQAERSEIYAALRAALKRYEPPFVARSDGDTSYELWSVKEMVIAQRARAGLFFAAAALQSSYVGFHFMPIYCEPSLKEKLKPELLRTLKGKSCFHITKLDATILRQITEALEIGHKAYKKRGWV